MAKQEDLKPKTANEEETSLADSKKIDLYINNQEEEKGISILNIFTTLGKRFKLYAWLIVSTFLLGLLVPTLMYTFKDKNESAMTVLALDYAGADEGQAPDGSKLDISYIKSSYIVNNALNNVTLSKKISTAQVQNNLVITGILSDRTKQEQDILEKLLAEKNNEYGKMLREFTLTYRPQYIISIDNIFKENNSKTILPASDLQLLLTAITNSYNEYFVDTYQDNGLPNDYLSAINEESLDYLEIIDEVSNSLAYLSDYCANKAAFIPNYRTTEGVSFSDLKQNIDTFRKTDITQYAAFIYEKNVYKNKDILKTSYEAQKQDAELDLVEINGRIANYEATITAYKNGTIVVSTPDGGSVNVPKTDAEYNKLVMELGSLNEQKSSIEERISILNDRITKLDDDPATAAQKATAEAYVNQALTKARTIYTQVNNSTKELFASNAYQSRYMHSVTTTQSERLSDNLKLFLLGAAGGLALGLVIWVADAFIIEFRNAKKANENKETN